MTRPLRVVAVGTLFLTHTLSLPTHPGPGQSVRAHEYAHSRGGSAPAVLSVLSQLNVDKCWLVASLGGAQEARAVARELEAEGVSTRYCKVWEGAGVPAAWILHAGEWFSLLRTEPPWCRGKGGIRIRCFAPPVQICRVLSCQGP
jgi:sugar/nucleoside kinase (ribokinase family)